MDFLNPLLLSAVPLAGVAVLIHLLSRRRQDVIAWGAMRFLLEAAPRRRRRWRLEELLLMLLRVAAVLALILAMAQPRLRAEWWAGYSTREVVLVLDNSLSSALTIERESVFDGQLAAAEELVNRLDVGDRIRVLLAASPPEWLLREPLPLSGDARGQLVDRLRQVQPTLGSASMRQCLELALAAEWPDGAAPEIILLTDGQAHGWDLQSLRAWRPIQNEAAATKARVTVHLPPTPEGGILNRAVESVVATRTVFGVNEPFSLTAVIRNTGDQQAAAGMVRLEWEEEGNGSPLSGRGPLGDAFARPRAEDARPVPALAPGETAQASFIHTFAEPGVHALAVRLDGADNLSLDDEARIVIEATDSVPILVVEGGAVPLVATWRRDAAANSAAILERDAGYLLAALGHGSAAGAGPSPFLATVIPSFELTPERIRQHHCVVLANVALLQPEVIEALRAHVERGGGLWIIAGEATDRTFFNEKLFASGRGLAPLPLDDVIGTPHPGEGFGPREQFVSVRPPAANHAATRLLADLDRLDIDQVKVYRRWRFKTEKETGALVAPAGEAATPGRLDDERKAPVPFASALLATGEGEPLAVEKIVGQGRVIVHAMPLDMRWSNLPIAEAFVVMVHEWLWYLAEPLQTRWTLAPGEVLAAAFPADTVAEMADVRLPDGRKIRLSSTIREDRASFRFGRTLQPGAYQLDLADTQGDVRPVPFQVRRDAAESDLTLLTAADRQALTDHAGIQFSFDPLVALPKPGPAAPWLVWPVLLLAVIALMLAELLLAGRLARHRGRGLDAAPLETAGTPMPGFRSPSSGRPFPQIEHRKSEVGKPDVDTEAVAS